eukprot:TRINITY_DN12629_c0_g1_i4.p1 TRINITY_DN12629_c0_g1~~TRINITY_DN12629_c0_g1_i4.p1  ORF type:complete len:970 (+),score=214.68 TRINITY_DN12629_c0_g1_i4:24-2933(+)
MAASEAPIHPLMGSFCGEQLTYGSRWIIVLAPRKHSRLPHRADRGGVQDFILERDFDGCDLREGQESWLTLDWEHCVVYLLVVHYEGDQAALEWLPLLPSQVTAPVGTLSLALRDGLRLKLTVSAFHPGPQHWLPLQADADKLLNGAKRMKLANDVGLFFVLLETKASDYLTEAGSKTLGKVILNADYASYRLLTSHDFYHAFRREYHPYAGTDQQGVSYKEVFYKKLADINAVDHVAVKSLFQTGLTKIMLHDPEVEQQELRNLTAMLVYIKIHLCMAFCGLLDVKDGLQMAFEDRLDRNAAALLYRLHARITSSAFKRHDGNDAIAKAILQSLLAAVHPKLIGESFAKILPMLKNRLNTGPGLPGDKLTPFTTTKAVKAASCEDRFLVRVTLKAKDKVARLSAKDAHIHVYPTLTTSPAAPNMVELTTKLREGRFIYRGQIEVDARDGMLTVGFVHEAPEKPKMTQVFNLNHTPSAGTFEMPTPLGMLSVQTSLTGPKNWKYDYSFNYFVAPLQDDEPQAMYRRVAPTLRTMAALVNGNAHAMARFFILQDGISKSLRHVRTIGLLKPALGLAMLLEAHLHYHRKETREAVTKLSSQLEGLSLPWFSALHIFITNIARVIPLLNGNYKVGAFRDCDNDGSGKGSAFEDHKLTYIIHRIFSIGRNVALHLSHITFGQNGSNQELQHITKLVSGAIIAVCLGRLAGVNVREQLSDLMSKSKKSESFTELIAATEEAYGLEARAYDQLDVDGDFRCDWQLEDSVSDAVHHAALTAQLSDLPYELDCEPDVMEDNIKADLDCSSDEEEDDRELDDVEHGHESGPSIESEQDASAGTATAAVALGIKRMSKAGELAQLTALSTLAAGPGVGEPSPSITSAAGPSALQSLPDRSDNDYHQRDQEEEFEFYTWLNSHQLGHLHGQLVEYGFNLRCIGQIEDCMDEIDLSEQDQVRLGMALRLMQGANVSQSAYV